MTQDISEIYQALRIFGLSRADMMCYQFLFHHHAATAQELSTQLGYSPTSVYARLKRLETKHFVASIKVSRQPLYFHAKPLYQVIKRY